MEKISVILNVYNEGHLLDECLASVKPYVDEIIVTDMHSNDNSREIADRYGCRVLTIPHAPVVEETIVQKVLEAKNDWILSLDPDMRVPIETWEKIDEVLTTPDYDVVVFHMINRVFGKWVRYGHGSECNFYKLFRKSLFMSEGTPGPRIHGMVYDAVKNGRTLHLSKAYPILHLAYDDVFKCFYQHLFYARHEAHERQKIGEQFSYRNMVWQPVKKFLGDFGPRAAWKGGMPGVLFSLIAEIMVFQTQVFLWHEASKQSHLRASKTNDRD